jgi:hypothetical protein
MMLNQVTWDAEASVVWNIPTQRPATPPAIVKASPQPADLIAERPCVVGLGQI